MKYLLTILLLASLTASAQAPFKLNKFYPRYDIVEYPLGQTPKSLWIVVKPDGIFANTYPEEGSVWNSRTVKVPPVIPIPNQPTTVEVATKSAFDSLRAVVAALRESQATDKELDSLNKRVASIELSAPVYTLKVSQVGIPLLTKNADGTYTLKSIVQGTSTKLTWNDSTIVLPK
jgi:hypothetical protein